MLFWAVDNPAPANYLLISGDRDFSNALHQLRMRKYTILLAQPPKALAPLVAAARSVWLWTSLSFGGAPLSSGESSQLANDFNFERIQKPVVELNQLNQPMVSNSEDPPIDCQQTHTTGRLLDLKDKGKNILKTEYQPNISRSSSLPVIWSEPKNNDQLKPAQSQMKLFRKAPHEFFRTSEPTVSNSSSTPNLPSNQDLSGSCRLYPNDITSRTNNPHMQSMSGQDNMPFPVSHTDIFQRIPSPINGSKLSAVPNLIPDMNKLRTPQYPFNVKSTPVCHQQTKEGSNASTTQCNLGSSHLLPTGHNLHGGQALHEKNLNHKHLQGSEHTLSSHSTGIANTRFNNGIWRVQGCPPPSESEQCHIGIILLALNTLKVEKVMPTEENISDFISYGDAKYRIPDVKRALDLAIKQSVVTKQSLGALQFYVGKNEKLWKCVNIIGGNLKQYPKTWDGIQKFLTSSSGRSAILASPCR